MFSKTYGATTFGVEGMIIDVEVDSSNGTPAFEIVGLPTGAVKESKERVRTAIKNTGIFLKQQKITVNLAPANLKKEGAGLDLPIAVGLLASHGIIPVESLKKTLFAAELSLEGTLKGVPGILPIAIKARECGFEKIFVASENVNEAILVDELQVFTAKTLSHIIAHMTGNRILPRAEKIEVESDSTEEYMHEDFSDVHGQFFAKRALEVAAAGGHNVLMVGVPGSGKTMLARRVSTILPEMSKEEALEVTKIYSVAGNLKGQGLITRRPFYAPHHTTSNAALIGGGSIPKPGAVTLSHNGVLFLDELPEFGSLLESLREPLEDKIVTVSRVSATVTFPANFTLICAMNPCPCGWRGDPDHICTCTPNDLKRYSRRLSGPLLDRIDIHINVPRVKYEELTSENAGESSAVIRERVVKARKIQLERLSPYKIFCNSQMNHQLLTKFCSMNTMAKKMLETVFKREKFSARSHDRILKVARTIADLSGMDIINENHITEAINLRTQLYFSSN